MSDVIVKENKKGGQVYYIYDNKELMPKKLLCEDGIAGEQYRNMRFCRSQ